MNTVKGKILRSFDSGVHLLVLFRLMHTLHYKMPFCGRFSAHLVRQVIRFYTSCDISPRASIGSGCYFPHPLGIVIGDGVVIMDNVGIWQRVTLGSHGKKGALAYPRIESGACIYESSSVLGGVTIGGNAVVGAHSLVLSDVPSGKIAIGVPAKIR